MKWQLHWWNHSLVISSRDDLEKAAVTVAEGKLRIIVRVREEGESMADKVHCIRKTLRLMPEEAKMLAPKRHVIME